MNHPVRIAALLVALVFIAYGPAQAASDTDGDWAGGWNTWKKATKGDTAEYSSASEIKVTWEVLDVSGSDVKYRRKSFDKAGKETLSEEKTFIWSKIKMTFRMPYNVKVEWGTEEL